ncbi:MAG: hotdog family protein [Gammaproteobacteria bacterium]|nr:hotdog family protein [Gammaproteobacteria bacterium]
MQPYSAGELVPHSGDMSLLDKIVTVDKESLSARLHVREDGIFSRNQQVPAYVGIEYMAQAIAAFAGYHAKCAGQKIKLGFLLGTRKFNSNIEHYSCGELLTIHIKQLLQAENGMAAFECHIEGDGISQRASLNVYQPENSEEYLKRKF